MQTIPSNIQAPAAMRVPTLRPYQEKAIAMVREEFQKGHQKNILAIATGGGKTTIASAIIAQTIKNGHEVLFIAHRCELIKQCRARLQQFGIQSGVIMAGWRQRNQMVMVASISTLLKRQHPPARLVIVDECHHSTSKGFRKILDAYAAQGSSIIGLTATPDRMDGTGLGDIYDAIVAPIQIHDLIGEGYLVPPRFFGPERDFSNVATTTKGDYESSALFSKFDKREMYANAIEHYKKFAPDSKAICFNVNIAHSLEMCRQFREAGIDAQHIDGGMSTFERERILGQFKRNEIKVLCNVNILTEGFDMPDISTVILNRATKSKTLYLQMVGRGLRTAPGKNCCIVIDQGANIFEHGPVDMPEEYTLEKTSEKKKKSKGTAGVKTCPNCQCLLSLSVMNCGHCSYEFPREQKKEVESTFAEVDTLELQTQFKAKTPEHLRKSFMEMTVDELLEYQHLKGYKIAWVMRQLQEKVWGLPKPVVTYTHLLHRVAEIKSYKLNWVEHQLKIWAAQQNLHE